MEKIKILWISLNAPAKKSVKAGGNTFNFYFQSFYGDERFDIKIIAQINNKLPLMDLKDGDHFYLKRSFGFFRKLNRLSSIESKYNPWNRNANLISNQMVSFVKEKIVELKQNGFDPDIVILEWTQCVVLAGVVRELCKNAYIVASEHDVTFVGYKRKANYYFGLKRIVWKYKYKREHEVEIKALKQCDLILVHNWDNRNVLMEEGIEKDKIQWLVPYFTNMRSCTRKPNGRDVLFYGAMDRPENYLSAIWFIEKVMPLFSDTNIRFIVLGSNPPAELRKYESEKIHITGFVDSIVSYFENAICLVAPLLLGAGIKVKIIEALSSGIPVLTNDIGIEGISATDGKEYFRCIEPVDYERSIRKLITEPSIGKEIESASKSFIQNNYLIDKSLADYKKRIIESREKR